MDIARLQQALVAADAAGDTAAAQQFAQALRTASQDPQDIMNLKPVPVPKTSGALGHFAKTLGLSQAPVAAGVAGFEAAAAPFAAAGPWAILPGLIGGAVGAYGASKAQDKIIAALPETAKKLGIDDETLAAGAKAHPIANTAAELLAQMEGFKPGFKAFKSVKGVADDLAVEIHQARRIAAANAAIGAVTSAAQQKVEGQDLDWKSIAEQAAMGAVLQEATPYGRRLQNLGRRAVGAPLIPHGTAPVVTDTPEDQTGPSDHGPVQPSPTEQIKLPLGRGKMNSKAPKPYETAPDPSLFSPTGEFQPPPNPPLRGDPNSPQMGFNIPGVPDSALDTRGRVIRELQSESGHDVNSIRRAVGVKYGEAVVELNKLKREGLAQYNPETKEWEILPEARGKLSPPPLPSGEPAPADFLDRGVPTSGHEIAPPNQLGPGVDTHPIDTGAGQQGLDLSVLQPPAGTAGSAPAAVGHGGVGGPSPHVGSDVAGAPRLDTPVAPASTAVPYGQNDPRARTPPLTAEQAQQVLVPAPGEQAVPLHSSRVPVIEQGGKSEPYFQPEQRAEPTQQLQPPAPPKEPPPPEVTRSERAAGALRKGNLGEALYHLMSEAGGEPKGPHQEPSFLRDLAHTLFNVGESHVSEVDRAKIVAMEKHRYAREVGITVKELEANYPKVARGIEDLVNNDHNLSKIDLHTNDKEGKQVLTETGKFVTKLQEQAKANKTSLYNRLVELPNGVRFNRASGEFESLNGKNIKAGAFGGAKVHVEGQPGADEKYLQSMKAEGNLAAYDWKTNTFYFTEAGLNDRTILHEMLHAATEHVLQQFNKDPSLLTSRQRKGAAQINEIYEAAKKQLGGKYRAAFENVHEFVAYAMTSEPFQHDLAKHRSASLEDVKNRYSVKDMMHRLTMAMARMLGLDRRAHLQNPLSTRVRASVDGDNAMLQVSAALRDIMTVPKVAPGEGVEGSTRFAKKAPKEVEATTLEELVRREGSNISKKATPYAERYERPGILKSLWKTVSTHGGREKAIANLQDFRRPLKILQRDLNRTHNPTNVHDLATGAGSETEMQWMRGAQLREKFETSLAKLMRSTGWDYDKTLSAMAVFAKARDEADYRRAMYLTHVPMTKAGDAERATLLKELGKGVDKIRAGQIRDRMEALGNTAVQATGESKYLRDKLHIPPGAPITVDMHDPVYNVAGSQTAAELKLARDSYAAFKHRPQVEEMFKTLKDIGDLTIEQNKLAGYHPPQLDGIIEFYRRPNYVPYKGDSTLNLDRFDIGSKHLSGSLSESQNKAEGRNTDSENPVLQVLSDNAKAAGRVGRRGFIDEVARLIKEGHITGVKGLNVPFEERWAGMVRKEDMDGPNKIIQHLPNGDQQVWTIKDPRMLEAVKGFTGDAGAFWRMLNSITSGIGRMHTAFNPAFGPWNFVRHTALTNGSIVGAEFGPATGARYASRVLATVMNGGLYRAATVSRLLHAKDIEGLKNLKDPASQQMYRYLQNAGRVSYEQAMGIRSQQEELSKSVGPSSIFSTLKHVADYFHIWSDMFELAGRAAGHEVIEQAMLEKAKATGDDYTSDKAKAKIAHAAAQYTKNLFNYGEVGKYGREAGAVFMFLRPALTTAVRFHDALAPAYMSEATALSRLPKSVTEVDAVQARILSKMPKAGMTPEARTTAAKQQAEAQVKESIDYFKKDFAERKKNAQLMAAGMMGAGYALYTMALMAGETDDQDRNKVATDNMELWARNMRLPAHGMLGKGNDYFQLPWGWGFGVFGSFGAQIAGATMGKSSIADMAKNMIPVAMEAMLPLPVPKYDPIDHPLAFVIGSVTPSFARPMVEFGMNVDEFGREIYTNRMNAFGDPYTGGEHLPAMYGAVTSMMADHGLVIDPTTLHFFLNSYADGVSRLTANATGLGMTLAGKRDIDLKEDLLPLASFIGKSSSYDAREFSDMEKTVKRQANMLKLYEDRPELRDRYLEDHPNAEIVVKFYETAVNGQLKQVRHQIRQVEGDPNIDEREKRETLKDLRSNRDWIMRSIIDSVADYSN